MITEALSLRIRQTFRLEPTREQSQAIETFCRFITSREPHTTMMMRGCAGTGKTSLAGAFVRTLLQLQQKVVLLAPTGRAAKVFSQNSGYPAFTIHRKIYRQKTLTDLQSGFSLNDNMHTDTLFLVDEASMIANGGPAGGEAFFGSGYLLDDLIQYVYSGRNCRLMLIGDKAQLPPVGEEESPALTKGMLEEYGLQVEVCDLNEVLRQSQESGILFNATMIRQMIEPANNRSGRFATDPPLQLPRIRFHAFADIQMVPGNELVEQLNSSYSKVGIDETMVITRSNKRANIYNEGIRRTILDREEVLNTNDLLMVVKNNYYWVKPGKEEDDGQELSFIANGDRVKVLKVRNVRELYQFHFADVLLQFPDYHDFELQTTVILDSLTTEAPALTPEQNELLFHEVMVDYADIPYKRDRIKKIKEDPYYNALQIKYAYAVTCHKAQGGQWAHVYLDQGYMTDDMLSPDYIHWLYTAFTRATEKLFLVNWPTSQIAPDNP